MALEAIVGHLLASSLGKHKDTFFDAVEVSTQNLANNLNALVQHEYERVLSSLTFSQSALDTAQYVADRTTQLAKAAGRHEAYEVAMLMYADKERLQQGVIHVEDITVGRQQVVQPAFCTISSKGFALAEEDQPGNATLIGWAHSHGSIGIFYSSEDDSTMQQMADTYGSYVPLAGGYMKTACAVVVNSNRDKPEFRMRSHVPHFSVQDDNLVVEERIVDTKVGRISKLQPKVLHDVSDIDYDTLDRQLCDNVYFTDGVQLGALVDPGAHAQPIVDRHQPDRLRIVDSFGLPSLTSFTGRMRQEYMQSAFGDDVSRAYAGLCELVAGRSVSNGKRLWSWDERVEAVSAYLQQHVDVLDERVGLLGDIVANHSYLKKKHPHHYATLTEMLHNYTSSAQYSEERVKAVA